MKAVAETMETIQQHHHQQQHQLAQGNTKCL